MASNWRTDLRHERGSSPPGYQHCFAVIYNGVVQYNVLYDEMVKT